MAERTQLTALEERAVAVETRLEALEDKVTYINSVVVRGNGKPSLIEDVHTLITFMNDQKDSYKYWSRWIIAGVLANIIGLTFAAVVWFIKILPVLDRLTGMKP
jgi:hypothetical protein